MDSKHIRKHRDDVAALSRLLSPADRFTVAARIRASLFQFCEALTAQPGDPKLRLEQVAGRILQAYVAADAARLASG